MNSMWNNAAPQLLSSLCEFSLLEEAISSRCVFFGGFSILIASSPIEELVPRLVFKFNAYEVASPLLKKVLRSLVNSSSMWLRGLKPTDLSPRWVSVSSSPWATHAQRRNTHNSSNWVWTGCQPTIVKILINNPHNGDDRQKNERSVVYK